MQNLVIHPQNSEAFELEAVSRVLIELRLRKSQERHREHLHRQITHAAKIPDTVQGELEKLLPPRRQWKRPAHRGASTHRMKKRALEAAVLPKLCGDGEGLKESGWGKRLLAFAAEVQERYRHPERGLSAPERMDIPKTDGKTRTLSLYTDLHERVLLRLLFLELRRVLDPSLSEHVLAFRANRPDGRHDAVRILGKRAADPAPCFAGELDICAFFDEIDHSAVLRSLEEAALDLGCVLDPLAVAWVKAYLDSTKKKKGIPQGGSLSPLLCNLVLRNADQAVREACPHPGTLYFRYCDDMILITNAEADCARGLDAFLLALENLQLRSHAFTRADSLHEKEFLCQKSKRPYLWSTKKEEPNACAWVSYMGYEIHRGGGMRVRGKSLNQHREKLDREFRHLHGLIRKGAAIETVKKVPLGRSLSLMKTYFIHKSVGRDPRGENPNAQPHWGAGFRLLDFNAWSRAQLRQLDREMSRRFAILSKLAPEWDPFLRELAPEPYVGAPFSYYERFRDPRHLRPKRRHKIQIMGTSGCCALDFFCEESGAVSG